MATDADPIIGNWYRHQDKGRSFEVVAVDAAAGLVELQYLDGDLDEIELALWYQQDVEPIAAPEDWAGPIDNTERDAFEEADRAPDPNPSEPLHGFRREREQWEKYDPETLQDKRGEGYPEEEPWQDDEQP